MAWHNTHPSAPCRGRGPVQRSGRRLVGAVASQEPSLPLRCCHNGSDATSPRRRHSSPADHDSPRPLQSLAPRPIMADSGWLLQWTIVLSLTALCLSLVVVAQVIASYSAAYKAAPRDVATFADAVDFSIHENESYDCDVAKVQRLEDKLRLGRLLREIQRAGDDLREALNRLLVGEDSTSLRTAARLLWASRRLDLEDRVRRLDLLRMRFLVVYMGVMASAAHKQSPPSPPPLPQDPEKTSKLALQKSLTESMAKRRRLTTHAIGHQDNVATPHRKGWAGVVEELQTSPRMQRRHASLEQNTTARPT